MEDITATLIAEFIGDRSVDSINEQINVRET
jgi:hypothetical protein